MQPNVHMTVVQDKTFDESSIGFGKVLDEDIHLLMEVQLT